MPRSARSHWGLWIVCLLMAACLTKDATDPGDRRIALFVRADVSATTVASVVVVVTAADIPTPLVFNILLANGVASGTIDLPAGSSRTITMHAYDANGIETYRGSVTVTIWPGTNPTIPLVLTSLKGDVPIDVTLGSTGITVGPGVTTLPILGTAELTATVRDAYGAPVSQPVTWATTNPGIATVTSTGDRTAQVTAVGTGSTNIVATFGGSAGSAAIVVSPPVPTFPGAEGYGATTRAGRGGQVIHVTNLDDAGPGSLRDALTATGPRTVVFDVSGYIRLASGIEVGQLYSHSQDFLTVAGQTAPSPGITVVGTITVRSNHALIQHIRIRPGIAGTTDRRDALTIEGPIHRVVIDHVSVSWAGNSGKNMSISAGSTSDVTISSCINSEAFPFGMLIVDDSKNITVSRSLFAHNFDRNPEVASNTSVTFTNNLIYNPGGVDNGVPRFFFAVWRGQADGTLADGPAFANVIGNVAKRGPTSGDLRLEFHELALPGSRAYTADNVFPEGIVYADGTGFLPVGTPAFPLPIPLTLLGSSAVEAYVLAYAGARPADRDAVDTRIINDVINGTGNSMLTDETDVGGFPPLAENSRVLTIPSDYATIRPSGYSVLEEDILFPLARTVEGRP